MRLKITLLIGIVLVISGCENKSGEKNLNKSLVNKIKEPIDFSVGHYPFKLPELQYNYDSLEPHLDAQTMKIHLTKHHQAYVDNLNKALKDYPELHDKDLGELLKNFDQVPESIRAAVRNHGGGHYNHSFYWVIMTPGGNRLVDNGELPDLKLAQKIDQDFGSFENFKKEFIDAAKTKFGSGWAWLSLDKSGKLVVTSSSNQDSPLSDGLLPILTLDVWEHAYYLKYQNRRPEFIDAWWNVVDWGQVQKNYENNIKIKR